MTRIAINGYGRIGRCVVRAIYERNLQHDIEVVAINDLADFNVLRHLTRYDSTHGYFSPEVTLEGDTLNIAGHPIKLFSSKEPGALPWDELGVDIALECSGKFKQAAQLQQHLDAGARKVIASHPVADAEKTVVYGINHGDITPDQRIFSAASCTTNCLAPMVHVLDQAFGFKHGQMTTIHAYTNDQNLVDKAHSDMYRARAAAVSMLPTKTGAAKAVGLVLPHLKGKIDGMAVRVPTLNVSLVDLHCQLNNTASVDDINGAFREAAKGALAGILHVNDEPLVSIDFNHQPWSCSIDVAQTKVVENQVKLMGWYDNEWGFTNRLIDMVLHLKAHTS